MEELSQRRSQILKHIIEEYVTTAQPVSSDILVRRYVPSLSSATVRNEMSALEGMGYLSHPHTSAGRVPSDLGYRYYVEWLMGGARLTETEERTISHQFHQVELNIGEWLRLAGSVLASAVHNPVMVAAPAAPISRLRHLDLVRISSEALLIVAVLRSGAVVQQVLRADWEVLGRDLTDLLNEWNRRFEGWSAVELQAHAIEAERRPLWYALIQLLDEADRQSSFGWGAMHVEGLSYMAGQPEFGTGDRLRPVVEALERQGVLSSVMEPLMRSDEGVYVAIGQEQPIERLRECSIVVARYGRMDEMLGVVGVIGPTRLPYWRTVPMVSYVAVMLNRLLERTYLS
jgi:heat-inducible transcriptional repressor